MTINGLPLHPLVVHGAVVFAPLAGLCALAYLVPRWRPFLRWPLLVVSVLAALFVWFAAATGDALKHVEMRHAPAAVVQAIHDHERFAGLLQASTWLLAALALATWWFHARPGWARSVLLVLLPLGGVAALVLVVATGDAGARAVWAG